MPSLLALTYYAAWLCHALTLGAMLGKRREAATGLALIALLINGSALLLIDLESGHWPVFNIFESFLLLSFLLALLGLLHTAGRPSADSTGVWVWLEILLLLGITSLFPKTPSLFLYDHDYPLIVLFHGCRIGALACLLFSFPFYVRYRSPGKSGRPETPCLHPGRNYTLLGAALFMTGEYVGLLWCQLGWGDVWSWSGGFFQSTLIVLYLMLVFHLPGSGRRTEGIRTLMGGMSGFFMLGLIMIRGLS